MKAPTLTPPCRACGRDLTDGSCSFCDVPITEPEVMSPSERVFYCVARNPGQALEELAELLGETDDTAKDRLSKMLARLRSRGALSSEGGRMDRVYFAVDAGKLPHKAAPKPARKRRRVPASRPRPARPYDHKALRDRRRAEGKCYDCGASLAELEDWDRTRCPECVEEGNAKMQKYRATENGYAKSRAWSRKYHQEHAAEILERTRAKYLEHKIEGLCAWCSSPAVGDGMLCEAHLAKHREASREHERRKREMAHDKGLCIRCFKNPQPATHRTCDGCREKVRARDERIRVRKLQRLQREAA